ncbi:hypothetical protein OAF83_03740 [Rubripirellula sp.]|jgi:hypothetical protein|nr:hypothetical protein [Rubripirellula sp.]MDB4749997.1 hypothetical protein [Rubripirellula sp.]
MARFRFKTDKYYAAELRKVTQRPIENYPTRGTIHLLRLEFEIFRIIDKMMWLQGLGLLASRDLVIGTLVDQKKDSGLAHYCDVLGLKEGRRLADWNALENQGKWIKVRFGSLEEGTDRNKFERIESFDPKERKKYKVKRPSFDVAKKWVKIAHAAEYLGVSVSTARRKADKWAEAGYDDVVRRGAGSQREINMPLLWDLEEGK